MINTISYTVEETVQNRKVGSLNVIKKLQTNEDEHVRNRPKTGDLSFENA